MRYFIFVGVFFFVFGSGMLLGAVLADLEWYEVHMSDDFKCSLLDSEEICLAKKTINELSRESRL